MKTQVRVISAPSAAMKSRQGGESVSQEAVGQKGKKGVSSITSREVFCSCENLTPNVDNKMRMRKRLTIFFGRGGGREGKRRDGNAVRRRKRGEGSW